MGKEGSVVDLRTDPCPQCGQPAWPGERAVRVASLPVRWAPDTRVSGRQGRMRVRRAGPAVRAGQVLGATSGVLGSPVTNARFGADATALAGGEAPHMRSPCCRARGPDDRATDPYDGEP
jgi:hypothetical protein